jgi:hypothetical protein
MTTPTSIREQLRADYDELLKNPFPKLGYKVDGLPETSAVLAGFVTQALKPSCKEVPDASPIVNNELSEEVRSVCQTHQGSREAAELEEYMEKITKMEAALRRLISLQGEE